MRRLIEQQIDPRQANIDWEEFRERQRDAAARRSQGALVLDEVARREHVDVSEAEVEAEVERYAERTGRTAGGRPRAAREGRRAGPAVLGPAAGETVDFLLAGRPLSGRLSAET